MRRMREEKQLRQRVVYRQTQNNDKELIEKGYRGEMLRSLAEPITLRLNGQVGSHCRDHPEPPTLFRKRVLKTLKRFSEDMRNRPLVMSRKVPLARCWLTGLPTPPPFPHVTREGPT